MKMNRRHILAGMGALSATALLSGRMAHAQNRNLIVPTLGGVWEQFWRDTVAPRFTDASGAAVTLDVGNGRVFGANLRVAGVNAPPYSIVMTNEVFAEGLRKEGFFEQLDLSRLPNYDATYPIARNTSGFGVVASFSPIGIGYRTDLVRTPPTKWTDLWDNPEFRGRTGIYNFANSAGKMQLLLASLIYGRDQYDVDAGFEALANLGQVIQVDFNLSTALAAGEIIVAPFDFAEIARLKQQGLPVDYCIPEEGVLAFDQTLNILVNGPEKDLAYEYANFILSAEMQDLLMRQFYVSPTNSSVIVPEELSYQVPISGEMMNSILQWDWSFVNENQNALSERWAQTVG
jgi:putative spermidine/putrescine transport system substrate-binding protein